MFLAVVVCRDMGRFNVAKTRQQSIREQSLES